MKNVFLAFLVFFSSFASANEESFCRKVSPLLPGWVSCHVSSWTEDGVVFDPPLSERQALEFSTGDMSIWRSPAWMDFERSKDGMSCRVILNSTNAPTWRSMSKAFGVDRTVRIAVMHEVGHCMKYGFRLSSSLSEEEFADAFAVLALVAMGEDDFSILAMLGSHRSSGSRKDAAHDTSKALSELSSEDVRLSMGKSLKEIAEAISVRFPRD